MERSIFRKTETIKSFAEEQERKNIASNIQEYDVLPVLKIVRSFIRHKKLVCYGGTAINELVCFRNPRDSFYHKDDIPDYDFYSPKASDHARQLSNILYRKGYKYVEAKSGVHAGTFRIFTNGIQVADVTNLPLKVFRKILKTSIGIKGIRYAHPNYLRLSLYLELARPQGDVARWPKIYPRLLLLQKHYPQNLSVSSGKSSWKKATMKQRNKCYQTLFQTSEKMSTLHENIYHHCIKECIAKGWVLFGATAFKLYQYYDIEHNKSQRRHLSNFQYDEIKPPSTAVHGDIDALVVEAGKEADHLVLMLRKKYNGIYLKKHPGLETLPEHFEIGFKYRTHQAVICLYQTQACYAYYQLPNKLRVGTIFTILSFYYIFFFFSTVRSYYNPKHILCMAHYLSDFKDRHSSPQSMGYTWTSQCYGNQPSMSELRIQMSKESMRRKVKQMKHIQDECRQCLRGLVSDSDEDFLNYKPIQAQKIQQLKKNSQKKSASRKSKLQSQRRKTA